MQKIFRLDDFIDPNNIDIIRSDILGTYAEVGVVESISEGVVHVNGLYNAFLNEVVTFDSNDESSIIGIVRSLDRGGKVVVVVFNDYQKIVSGSFVKRTKKMFHVPISKAMIGRVLDIFGKPIDGGPSIKAEIFSEVEYIKPPSMLDRTPVSRPLLTGTIAIDSMISIGRGQRELIMGEIKTGKTSLAVGAIINQKSEYIAGKPVYCFYVAIGQSQSSTASVVKRLKEAGAMEYTTIISASAADSAHSQFMAPYVGCAIAEYFMKNNDCLIIYDDLLKHAKANRQIGRLMGVPGGRDAYPADSFAIHARLLERAACTSTGTLTAIPIVEIKEGEFSDFIATNVVSITDGQIVLSKGLMHNQMPPVNIGLSVTRIGSAAQSKAMKLVSSGMKNEVALYEDINRLKSFAGDQLDEAQVKILQEGDELIALLNQNLDQLYTLEEQVVLLFGVKEKLLRDVKDEKIKILLKRFLEYIKHKQAQLMKDIASDNVQNNIKEIISLEVKEFRASLDLENL